MVTRSDKVKRDSAGSPPNDGTSVPSPVRFVSSAARGTPSLSDRAAKVSRGKAAADPRARAGRSSWHARTG
jgi:hypothetical protein